MESREPAGEWRAVGAVHRLSHSAVPWTIRLIDPVTERSHHASPEATDETRVDSKLRGGGSTGARPSALLASSRMAAALAPAAARPAPPRISAAPEGRRARRRSAQTLRAGRRRVARAAAPTWSWWRCDGPRPTSDDCDADRGREPRPPTRSTSAGPRARSCASCCVVQQPRRHARCAVSAQTGDGHRGARAAAVADAHPDAEPDPGRAEPADDRRRPAPAGRRRRRPRGRGARRDGAPGA